MMNPCSDSKRHVFNRMCCGREHRRTWIVRGLQIRRGRSPDVRFYQQVEIGCAEAALQWRDESQRQRPHANGISAGERHWCHPSDKVSFDITHVEAVWRNRRLNARPVRKKEITSCKKANCWRIAEETAERPLWKNYYYTVVKSIGAHKCGIVIRLLRKAIVFLSNFAYYFSSYITVFIQMDSISIEVQIEEIHGII